MKKSKSYNLFPYKLAMPAFLVVIITGIIPIVYSIFISLQEYEMTNTDTKFIWFKNYIDLLTDSRFLHSIIFTITFSLVATVLEMIFGFIIAYLLADKQVSNSFSSIVRTLLMIPYMVAPIVISYTFKTLVYDSSFGYLNYFLKLLHLPAINIFAGQWNAAIAVLVMEVLLRMPFVILIIYAGLSTVSESILEASQIDGTTTWTRIKLIILPIIKPIMIVAFIFRFMDCLKMFDEMYVLTRGGPGYTTENLSLYVSAQAFEFFHMGKATAASLIFFLVVILMSLLIFKGFAYKRKL